VPDTLTICPSCGDKDYSNVICRRCRAHIRKTMPGPHPYLDALDAADVDGKEPLDGEAVISLLERVRGPYKTAPVSDAELQGIAAQAFNMFKRDVERRKFNFLLASYHAGQGIHRMAIIEAEIVERLGEDWLNGGRTKDIGFRMLRLATKLLPPDAVIFGSVVNHFRQTAKLGELTDKQRHDLIGGGHDRQHQAVKEGYLTVCDALAVVAQTPKRVCFYQQDFDRRLEPVGAPKTTLCGQDEFDGRMKMYGGCMYDKEPVN
jgi:hypothetical protein